MNITHERKREKEKGGVTHERKREKEKGGEQKWKGANGETGKVNYFEAQFYYMQITLCNKLIGESKFSVGI